MEESISVSPSGPVPAPLPGPVEVVPFDDAVVFEELVAVATAAEEVAEELVSSLDVAVTEAVLYPVHMLTYPFFYYRAR